MSEVLTAAVHRSWAADLDPRMLYELLRLRVAVFVVEQECAYAELDGRDLEHGTRHYWLGGTDVTGRAQPLLGYLRLLVEPDGEHRIGRVCTAVEARGQGLARRLMQAALAEVGHGGCVLDAQAHLAGFYRGFGFEPAGEEYDWDGVAHLPMRRAPRPA